MTITAEQAIKSNHNAEWASFDCPAHHASHPTARINTRNLYWVCMSCHAKGHMDEIIIEEEVQLDYISSLLVEQPEQSHWEAELDQYDIDGPGDYWLSRFTPEACREFRLGQMGEYPVYPIRDSQGDLLGVVKRNPYGERPKYRYPKGVPTSRLLFGYERVTDDTIMLVEGAPDVIAAWEVGVTALGCYGAILSPPQIALLSRLEPSYVAVAYDDDPAGEKGASEAVRALLGVGLMAGRLVTGFHDVADVPLDVRGDTLREALDRKATIDYLVSCG